jgi:hypothetical protein
VTRDIVAIAPCVGQPIEDTRLVSGPTVRSREVKESSASAVHPSYVPEVTSGVRHDTVLAAGLPNEVVFLSALAAERER